MKVAQITVEMIRALRERTGAGMMDVKRALEQAGGNEEEAVRILRERGLAQAAKRAGRAALEGLVEAFVAEDRRSGALVEVNCETDFVARTEAVRALARAMARLAAESGIPAGVAAPGEADRWDPRGEDSLARVKALLQHPLPGFEGRPASEAVAEVAGKVGEHVRVRRFATFRTEGILDAYVHGDGRIGVLMDVEVEPRSAGERPEIRALIRDLAMQVAAFRAEYVDRSQVPQAVVQREQEIYRAAARNEGKPERVLDKIVAGRVEKFYQEVCLVDQPFMRDAAISVGRHVEQVTAPLGARLRVRRFARFERAERLTGEGERGEE